LKETVKVCACKMRDQFHCFAVLPLSRRKSHRYIEDEPNRFRIRKH